MTRLFLVVPVLAVLGTVACASDVPPLAPGPERDRVVLTGAEIDAIARIIRLEDHRTFDSDEFRRLAADASVEVRRRAAVAAGRIRDDQAVPLLVDLLSRDPSPAVRADAAFALGLVGDTSAHVIDALRAAAPREWAPVRPLETTVVVEVVGALGRLGSDRARAEVVDALRRVHPALDPHSHRIAAEGLLAMWRFTTGPARVSSAARFLDHPDPELRWRAALALVRLDLAETAPRLLALVDDPDPRVRALAVRGLTAVHADSAGVSAATLDALAAALSDSHPHVRINAVRSLATFGDRASARRIAGMLRDEDPNAASAAAEALAALGDRSAEPLSDFVADDVAPIGPRATALAALAALDPVAARPVVAMWAEGDTQQRYAAARAAGALGWTQGRALIETLIDDADPRVAVAATQAAASLAADTAAAAADPNGLREVLLRVATAEEPRQRTPALRGLIPLLEAGDLPVLLTAYERSVGITRARGAAIAAIAALGRLAQDDPVVAQTFFDRLDAPEDRWLRRAAADALGAGWGASPQAVAAEDLEHYREMVARYVEPALADGRRPAASILTRHGEIRIELLAEEAPLTVHNFLTLSGMGFYDDGVWHRVVPNFVIQDGAPAGDPSGGPGWTIRDEINRVRYERGIMGMALAGPDTGGSQWFLTHSDQPHLDGGFTVFGKVVAGERVMDRVVQGEPVIAVRVTQ